MLVLKYSLGLLLTTRTVALPQTLTLKLTPTLTLADTDTGTGTDTDTDTDTGTETRTTRRGSDIGTSAPPGQRHRQVRFGGICPPAGPLVMTDTCPVGRIEDLEP